MSEDKKPQFTWTQKRKALWRHLAPFRGLLVWLIIAGVLAAVANAVVPYITGKFFDTLISPYTVFIAGFGSYPAWSALLFLWAVIQLLANVTSWIIDRSTRQLTTKLEAGIQASAFVHLLTLPISYHKTHRTGEVTENVSKAGWMSGSVVNTTLQFAPQMLTVIIGVGISFAILPSLAFILLAGLLVYIVFLFRILPTTSRYQEEGFRIWNRAYGDAQDAYTNVQTVKQAAAEEYEGKRIFSGFLDKAVPVWFRMEKAWNNLNFSQRIVVTLTQGAIFFYSVYLIQQGAITIGDLIAFNAYAGMIIGPFVSLGHQWQTVQNGLVALARAEVIFDTPSEMYEPIDAVRLPNLVGGITFENVHFAYDPDQAEVLSGVSFKANPGEVVAFVGETGVGKSTSVELISGYYFASKGRVLIDGFDIQNVNLRDLRRQMAVVPQEVVLFNASIKENIRYGRPDATNTEVEAAARRAHADGFIDKFPQKYEQEVGERGIKLSVGQKQRVAIARAILRNPRILILDEPTSALDAETETYISKSLNELMRGRTTFIIAHRLSTVRKADKILVLKDGLIAEEGSHEDLMQIENGMYRHLYELHIGLHE